MAKGNIFEDSFEQLVELGVSTTKKTVKSVAQIVNPFDKTVTPETNNDLNKIKTQEIKDKINHTPVNFEKLKNKFQDKDKLQAEALRNRFFQMVKNEDEKILEREDIEEAQKIREEELEAQEKKRKEQEKIVQEHQAEIPGGKTKRGVMTRKKIHEQQHVENKPASGKQ